MVTGRGRGAGFSGSHGRGSGFQQSSGGGTSNGAYGGRGQTSQTHTAPDADRGRVFAMTEQEVRDGDDVVSDAVRVPGILA